MDLVSNRLSSTIDGNVTLSGQLYSYVTSVNSVFVSDKIINNCDSLRLWERILCVLYFLFLHCFNI